MENVSVIIGTAGHVDHGKTTLIKALTGVDTDRLEEEKARKLSIDLGFAPFRLPGGRIAGVIDVPGHEKFMRNMLAGVAGMDLVLLVIDAQEGVMPQTREHLDVLKILGINRGIIILTKIDLVEDEWLELMKEEVREELAGYPLADAPMVAISAVTGEGLEELKDLIDRMVEEVEPHSLNTPFRLPVDRSFHLSGFGTIVTGTLVAGSIKSGSQVQLLPQDRYVRVRQIQVHGKEVEEARAGQRVALNLSNISPGEIPRGTEVVEPGYYHSTSLIDVQLQLLENFDRKLKNRARVHLHLGTNVVLARVLLLDRNELLPGQQGFAQLKLEKEVVAHFQDKFIIRFYSPVYTIGGGRILNPRPEPHRRFQEDVLRELSLLTGGRPQDIILQLLLKQRMLRAEDLTREIGFTDEETGKLLSRLSEEGKVIRLQNYYLHPVVAEEWQKRLKGFLKDFHASYPLRSGVPGAELRKIFPASLSGDAVNKFLELMKEKGVISLQEDRVALEDFEPCPDAEQKKKLDLIKRELSVELFSPPTREELEENLGLREDELEEYLNFLEERKEIYRVSPEIYFSRRAVMEAQEKLIDFLEKEEEINLGQFRDMLKTSRKYALPFLEYFDSQRVTVRHNDLRRLGNRRLK